ncbi:glucosamine-6-phosphate deaminase [Mycoplasma iguanae]|uniref:Glucosamine-6-phosphate deaminase n=1 Tax=Mycoplasma iguanae TaxID=292461 RepID=A0ABY5RC49_9MOLU|nr:glucosamine-6-phosphate deaminase [Mycoplasma iguanae]UVD81912.1 glucosamine-6-phosphate deaminase [Mycoplasma iguanae]
MKISTFTSKEEASVFVAFKIYQAIVNKPDLKLGLATGETPINVYKELVKLSKENKLDYSQVKTFNLDEYSDIDIKNSQSYHAFMEENLFQFLPTLKKENIHFPDAMHDYDGEIEKNGGIDLQILGIGVNGHIAFNEPGSVKDSKTRKIKLKESTILANSRFFNSIEEVPKFAYSMGLDTIMKAKKIIILIFGAAKKEAFAKLYATKQFDINFPASILHEHPDVEVILDNAAASLVKLN